MSGVYIEGMEPPKNCDECWKKYHGFGMVEHDEEWGTFYCKLAKGFCSDPRTKCPLVPVPEHGGEIKPCPFCGKEPVMVKDIRYPRPKCKATDAYEIMCNTFGCPIYKADNTYFFSRHAAVAAWNTRMITEPPKEEKNDDRFSET